MGDVNILVSFLAGIVSFLSPCVMPIIPGFLAYLAGSSLDESDANRAKVFKASVFFVLGFSVVFSILGVLLNTVLSAVAFEFQAWLSRIGGALIILFGLYLTGLLDFPVLEKTYRVSITNKFRSRNLTSFAFGAAFAAGWTPCVGAVLGGILGLAATMPGSALTLLLAYSLGLGMPFLLVGLFASRASDFIEKYSSILNYINIGFGVLLIVIGVLAFTQSLDLILSFGFINDLLIR